MKAYESIAFKKSWRLMPDGAGAPHGVYRSYA